jgi:hypothetical protein
VRTAFLREGFARGFLSRLWASRRGLFSLADLEDLTRQMLTVRDQLNPRNTDQAFINFCCDSRRVRMGRISDLIGDLAFSCWARQPGRVYEDANGVWRIWDHGGNDHNKRLMLLHWAGQGLQTTSQPHVLRRFGGRVHRFSLARLTSGLRRSYVFRRVIFGRSPLGRALPPIPPTTPVQVDDAR